MWTVVEIQLGQQLRGGGGGCELLKDLIIVQLERANFVSGSPPPPPATDELLQI